METNENATGAQEQHRGIPADTFRARLRLARLHAGDITIREAAERAGVNHASWANWEKGMEPRGMIDIVEAISEGLGVDRDWLLFGGRLAKEERRAGRVIQRRERRESNLSSPHVPDRRGARSPVQPTQPAGSSTRRPARLFARSTDSGR